MNLKRIIPKTDKIKKVETTSNVQYENDYVVPKTNERDTFYHNINMDFSQALAALKAGKRVTRESWGKNKFLVITKESIIKMEEMPDIVRAELERHLGIKGIDSLTTNAHIDICSIEDGFEISAWNPSQSDLLQEDWCTLC